MTTLRQSNDNVTMTHRHVINATLQMFKTIPNITLIFYTGCGMCNKITLEK